MLHVTDKISRFRKKWHGGTPWLILPTTLAGDQMRYALCWRGVCPSSCGASNLWTKQGSQTDVAIHSIRNIFYSPPRSGIEKEHVSTFANHNFGRFACWGKYCRRLVSECPDRCSYRGNTELVLNLLFILLDRVALGAHPLVCQILVWLIMLKPHLLARSIFTCFITLTHRGTLNTLAQSQEPSFFMLPDVGAVCHQAA